MFSVCRDDCILYLLSITYSCAPPIVAALLTGATTLFADAKEIPAFPQLVARHGVTLFYASPLVYRMILNEGETIAGCLGGVRLFITTGSRLPDATAEEFRTRAGKEIVQRYGLNECGGVLANLSGDRKKRGSVGIAAGMEVKLKVERDAPRKDGAPGELLVRGPGLFEGYCSPWRLRDEVLDDGWFKTGDLMRRDEDGYYWIVGRTKEVINVGGVKVFPHEVEEMLLTHPAVEEALVFGVAEPRFGEAPHGKVKLRAGAACTERELLRFVNERLSVFKTLRAVEFVNEIPKTVTDKPKRSGAIKSRTV
jgi:long-chain acyl-CoA synthetase